ncbi:dihydrofolate reductase [Piscinibacter sakaiensis]|uniref:dihydrofolate reductase n=1 Tax=Piscinibacter sakaiensis TaxID=1547922 RepID=UPI003AAD1488
MPRLSLIAALDRNRLIGVDGVRMPWHLPQDLRHFRRTTTGRPVIMGRRTFESIGKPLPGRLNIVLSRSGAIEAIAGKLQPAASLSDARRIAEDWIAAQTAGSPLDPEVMVIGGADVYAQAIDGADRLYLTEIDAAFDGNVHFPAFREMQPGWIESSRETHRAEPPNDFAYSFVTYDRLAEPST